jgi:hypothetical protein
MDTLIAIIDCMAWLSIHVDFERWSYLEEAEHLGTI